MGALSAKLNAEEKTITESPVTATQLAALLKRIADNTISNNAAKQVFEALWEANTTQHSITTNANGTRTIRDFIEDTVKLSDDLQTIDQIIEAKGLKQMNDTGALEKIIDEVIAANPANVEQYKAGKDKAFNALVGQVMKASKGKANPGQVNELLKAKLQ